MSENGPNTLDTRHGGRFWQTLWVESRDVIKHAYHFIALLVVLATFAYMIPRLPFTETMQQLLTAIDAAGIIAALMIYTASFVYQVIKHIVHDNPELRVVGDRIRQMWPYRPAAVPNATHQIHVSWNKGLNLVCDWALVASTGAAAVFAVHDNWSFVFSIPVVFFVKGAIGIASSPPEVAQLNWLYLLCIVLSTSIGAANLHRKSVPPSSWWIPAVGLFGFSIGTRIGADRLEELVRARPTARRDAGQMS